MRLEPSVIRRPYDKVSKLVLVSPDVEASVAQQLKCDTLLIWAKNDVINPFFWTRRFRGRVFFTIYSLTILLFLPSNLSMHSLKVALAEP